MAKIERTTGYSAISLLGYSFFWLAGTGLVTAILLTAAGLVDRPGWMDMGLLAFLVAASVIIAMILAPIATLILMPLFALCRSMHEIAFPRKVVLATTVAGAIISSVLLFLFISLRTKEGISFDWPIPPDGGAEAAFVLSMPVAVLLAPLIAMSWFPYV